MKDSSAARVRGTWASGMVGPGGGSGSASMQILERGDVRGLPGHGANAARGGAGRRKRGNARNVVANGGAANGLLVVEGLASERRIDHQIHFTGFDQIDDVRTAFVHFVNFLDVDSGARESRGCATRGDDLQSGGGKILRDPGDGALVVIVDAHEDGAGKRKALASGELRLGERAGKRGRDAHHFAGRAHFRTENDIDAAELVEWEDRRFDGE